MSTKKISKPRPTTYGPRISRETWIEKLPEIKRLYLTECLPLTCDRAGERSVIGEMKLQGFHAREGQYWPVLKENGIIKNNKRHDKKRGSGGRSSDVERNARAQLCNDRLSTEYNHAQLGSSHTRTSLRNNQDSAGFQDTRTRMRDHTLGIADNEDLGTADNQVARLNHSEHQINHSSRLGSLVSLGGVGSLSPVSSNTYEPFHWQNCVEFAAITQYAMPQKEFEFLAYQSSTSMNPLNELAKKMRFLIWPPRPKQDFSMQAAAHLTSEFMFTTMVNNLCHAQCGDLAYRHRWIASIPPGLISQFLGALPRALMPIFRDILFSVAICSGNKDAVLWILQLNPDLASHIAMPLRFGSLEVTMVPRTPVCGALLCQHFDIAHVLIEQQCLDESFDTLVAIVNQIILAYSEAGRWKTTYSSSSISARETYLDKFRDLLWLPLHIMKAVHEKTRPVRLHGEWYKLAISDKTLLERLLDLQRGQIKDLLEQDHFDSMFKFNRFSSSKVLAPAIETTLDWIYQEARESGCKSQLKKFLDEIEYRRPDDWLRKMISDQRLRFDIALPGIPPTFSNLPRSSLERLRTAITQGDETCVTSILEPIKLEAARAPNRPYLHDNYEKELDVFIELVEHATSSGQDQIAIELVLTKKHYAIPGMLILMMHNRFEAVLRLLSMDQALESALTQAHERRELSALERLLFDCPNTLFSDDSGPGVMIRAITCFALNANNKELLQMIFDSGRLYEDDGPQLQHLRDEHGDIRKLFIPSLLAVVACQKMNSMIGVLVDYGLDARHPTVLKHAIGFGASITTIKILLDLAVGDTPPYSSKNYGASGIIEAIRKSKYDVLRFILSRTDVNSVERKTGMTPLSQAIMQQDMQAIKILLDHGADPQKLVTVTELLDKAGVYPRKRFTPILIAIELENLALVRLLVDRGASVNHASQYCLGRSPLQRAAELGNFEIVEYLLANKADVDFDGIPDSGTALQLAAIQGYTGLADRLLHSDARVNAIPATEDGRTALEGAAEWGRLDTVLLLCKNGANFDLPVHGELQAERAMRFARKNGHGSLADYINHLWEYQRMAEKEFPSLLKETELGLSDQAYDFH